ncbi:ribosome biogenesis GTPase YlqF [Metamycoplasma hyosynoviae]|uniref:Ribosome biogenesis GTPase A n=1 Tax=Metamycoplasma hyosynoviae TaxID=29559 RepID=A0A4P1QGC6_9BACT|nr:ribosome biogenesis GTPase YlqF [Metamycoplasma hyosynoviae]ASI54107.1 GTPase [Metamycoplasma hyosynoviae]MDC8901282.1 ribosome biogenesis GTPase YlqF [Metamycoplasma hyosynoviae]MDC8912377.1 ribosome biogenesis GTPase YlqF [Metamycoplasma hyosynoviae]MDC8913269.1 ribosome biogenesis GTPase YlqF [Metamycoplasma hyosynoviae]MDC8914310.1 ribosome biogenesis GTPase YlqF [Metamycoplasma hyosynoviae]
MINWFPGHMAKTLRELRETHKLFDLFIIVLDARIPKSSFNLDIYKIINGKSILFIFNKIDKCDLNKLQPFLAEYKKLGKVLLTNLKSHSIYKKVNSEINFFYEQSKKKNELKNKLTPPLKCIVLGLPNVGKSTLINVLSKSSSAKVGNMAGVTKAKQWINCKNYMLQDTPGILIPKIETEEMAAKFIATTTIKTEVLNESQIVEYLYRLISSKYPERLLEINLKPVIESDAIFEEIEKYGKANNFLKQGGMVDTAKSIKVLIRYLQNLDNVLYD